MSNKKIIGFIDHDRIRVSSEVFFKNLITPINYELKAIYVDSSKCHCSVDGFFPKTDDYHDEVVREINKCDIIVTSSIAGAAFTTDMDIQWFHSLSSGVDSMINQLKPEKPLPTFQFTRQGDSFGQYMKEYIIGQIIASERGFYRHYDNQKELQWSSTKSAPKRLLSTLSISILGLGSIGREVAEYCKMFGMKIYGMVSVIPPKKLSCVYEYFTSKELPKYLELSDYVCCVLPHTIKTNNILSNGMLKHCAVRQSVIINVGRGNIYTENDIVEAIEKKWIRGAVLDTFDIEPLPSDSMLWNLPNTVITPHASAAVNVDQLRNLFMENLKLFDENKVMHYYVDWEKGY